jgi:hypothetical protein
LLSALPALATLATLALPALSGLLALLSRLLLPAALLLAALLSALLLLPGFLLAALLPALTGIAHDRSCVRFAPTVGQPSQAKEGSCFGYAADAAGSFGREAIGVPASGLGPLPSRYSAS